MEKLIEIPNWVLECSVNNCDTVEEFLYKYYKHERFTGRGADYEKSLINSYSKDIENRGYTLISKHDSVTGDVVAFVTKSVKNDIKSLTPLTAEYAKRVSKELDNTRYQLEKELRFSEDLQNLEMIKLHKDHIKHLEFMLQYGWNAPKFD